MAENSSTPPKDVINNARRGQELRRRYDRGNKRAPNLAKGEPVSESVLSRMSTFFSAASSDFEKLDAQGQPTRAQIDWMLWGGHAGHRWAEKTLKSLREAKDIEVQVKKADETLGIVFGYAIVCKEAGEEYFDVQGDHIPEESMLQATSEFMSGFRIAKDMHAGGTVGQVVFGFPMTEEIAKSLDITVERTGFIVGMKPDSDELLKKYVSGEYTGFSIGGRRIQDDEVSDA